MRSPPKTNKQKKNASGHETFYYTLSETGPEEIKKKIHPTEQGNNKETYGCLMLCLEIFKIILMKFLNHGFASHEFGIENILINLECPIQEINIKKVVPGEEA